MSHTSSPLPARFEEALQELEGIVKQLEEGKADLEGALALYERGHALRVFCEETLKKAKLRIDEVAKDAHGVPIMQPSALD